MPGEWSLVYLSSPSPHLGAPLPTPALLNMPGSTSMMWLGQYLRYSGISYSLTTSRCRWLMPSMAWKRFRSPCSWRPLEGVKIGLLTAFESCWKRKRERKDQRPEREIRTLRSQKLREPNLIPEACRSLCPDAVTHLVWNQRQPHALQVFALLAEDEMTLFGFGNDEIELHLFSQHRGREREGVKGRVGHLRLQRRKGGNVSSRFANLQATR